MPRRTQKRKNFREAFRLGSSGAGGIRARPPFRTGKIWDVLVEYSRL